MKSFILICLLCSTSAFAKIYQVNIGGMNCESCSNKIKKKFLEFNEVKSVQIDLKTDFMFLETYKNQQLEFDQIEKAIKELGYKVKSFKEL